MGYLYLGIGLLAGTVKAYCGKKTSGYTADIRDAMLVNALRMLFCVVIGLALLAVQGQLTFAKPQATVLAIAALSGVSTAVFVVTWLLSVKRGAYMMVEVSLMLGVLIPMVAGKVCFGESVRPTAWLGMAALVAATVIMGSYNQAQSRKLDAAGVLLLVVCGVANGLSDFSQKLFVRTLPELPIAVFNFYTYVFSALVLLPSLLLFARRSAAAATERPLLANILGYVIVMSVCLFANAYFRTKAAVYLDAAQLYPLSQGSALILSTLMAAIAFREKVTPTCVVGLAVAFAGLLLINVV